MRDHSVFIFHYTEKQSQGTWHADDDYEHTGWGAVKEYKSVYVAPSRKIAEAHWRYWAEVGPSDNPKILKSVEELHNVHVLLELP